MMQNACADWYRFRHALTREAMYGNLQGRERVLRHRAVIRLLEQQHTDEPVNQLAHHRLRAREFGQAKHYSQRAAERAMHIGAYREALVHFRTALCLISGEDIASRADLLLNLGYAAHPSGKLHLCRSYWDEAQRAFEHLGDIVKLAEVHRLLGRLLWEQVCRDESHS
jgi:predicted ATPase